MREDTETAFSVDVNENFFLDFWAILKRVNQFSPPSLLKPNTVPSEQHQDALPQSMPSFWRILA